MKAIYSVTNAFRPPAPDPDVRPAAKATKPPKAGMDRTSRFDQLRSRASARVFNTWFVVVSLGICLVAIFLGWQDKSWGAIYIAAVACPLANLVLMLLGTIAAVIFRRFNPNMKLGSMLPSVLGVPPLGALATAMAIFMMPLNGC